MKEKCRRSRSNCKKRKKTNRLSSFIMEEIVFDGEEFDISWLCKAEKPNIFTSTNQS